MELLSYVTDNPLVITAIITFFGVTIAAILNYSSNIKANKSKISIEEGKLKHAFTKECFDVLLTITNQLKEEKILKSSKKDIASEVIDKLKIVSDNINIYENILPFIDDNKIANLKQKSASTRPNLSHIEDLISKGNEFDEKDSEILISLSNDIIELNREYVKIIDNELIELGEKLRSFKID